MALQLQHLGVVGYGEVGRIFSAGLRAHFASTCVWDLKLAKGAPTRDALQAQALSAHVVAADGM